MKLQTVIKSIFLPRGYPATVTPDYTNYQIWDSVQAFCSTINGMLATQAMLKAIGVGDAQATSTSGNYLK